MLKNFLEHLEILQANTEYKIKNTEISTSIEHKHGVENYGYKIRTKEHIIRIVTGTVYFLEMFYTIFMLKLLILSIFIS